MKEAYRILPVCAGDVSGIASALYELGGMVVIHDPSGCNSTYNTHDEIRWYDQESYIFISGLNMRDAVLGNDQKLVDDIVEAAEELEPKPRFIAICNSPVPYLNGTDFLGICRLVERRTGIRTFYVRSDGMHDYVRGAGRAFLEYARHMLPLPESGRTPAVRHSKTECMADQTRGNEKNPVQPARIMAERMTDQVQAAWIGADITDGQAGRQRSASGIRVGVLGATPLTFGNRSCIPHLREILRRSGFLVQAVWAMGSTPNCIDKSTCVDVNLVVSDTGIPAARYLKETYGIPYVAGVPVNERVWNQIEKALRCAAGEGTAGNIRSAKKDGRSCAAAEESTEKGVLPAEEGRSALRTEDGLIRVFIGEAVLAGSLAAAAGGTVRILCPFPDSRAILGRNGKFFDGEQELFAEICQAQTEHPDSVIEVWADPMYRMVLPEGISFHSIPALAFSGRLHRTEFPDYFSWIQTSEDENLRQEADRQWE